MERKKIEMKGKGEVIVEENINGEKGAAKGRGGRKGWERFEEGMEKINRKPQRNSSHKFESGRIHLSQNKAPSAVISRMWDGHFTSGERGSPIGPGPYECISASGFLRHIVSRLLLSEFDRI